MSSYDFDWGFVLSSIPTLAGGLVTTLEIAALTIVLSMILAVPVAVARMAEFDLIRWIAQGYVELFRCTPMLVQLFWIYLRCRRSPASPFPGLPRPSSR
jgi:polar amino acid transport system permease protein